jgi:N-glycosylase/DNA lyase
MTNPESHSVSSGWRPVAGWLPSPADLAETLDGGQSFRWQSIEPAAGGVPSLSAVALAKAEPRVWTGVWSDVVVQLRLSDCALEWRGLSVQAEPAFSRYLVLDFNWSALTDSLPWRSDAHLARCIAAFPGLRILRQPFGETLLGFLCSATKQIVQIKQMCALLAERHGAPLHPNLALDPCHLSLPRHRLPTWPELAAIPEKELRACLLGFRARYIAETAKFLAVRPGWLDETEQLPYAAAKARLLELPGVGEKVADCVLLFGAGKLEAFPVDTWVLKSLARRYGLTGWKPAQVAHFGRTHFGPLAGLAQQYLFSWERKHGGR